MAHWTQAQQDRATAQLREHGIEVVKYELSLTTFRPVTLVYIRELEGYKLPPTKSIKSLISKLDDQFTEENDNDPSLKP